MIGGKVISVTAKVVALKTDHVFGIATINI